MIDVGDATVLIMGNTAFTPWARDQIRRLSGQARRRGIALVGADTRDNLRAAKPEELSWVDEVVELDVHDPNACRTWAAARPGIDAVLTIRELAVFPTAVIAQELGLAGNDPEAVFRIRNKDLCRERLREAGFPQPIVAVCDNMADAKRFMTENGPGPWIVKPRDGLASIGVSLIAEPDDLTAALQKFTAPPPAMGPLAASRSFLIETFISGEEFSAEGILIAGVPQVLALTRKMITKGFLEIGHRVPAGFDAMTARAATNAVSQALTVAGITRGIFHVEFWVTESGIVLGELHDRPGGDFIHTLIEYTRPGFDLYGSLINDLLNRAPEPIPDSTGAAAAEFFLAPPGRVRAVQGWEELSQHPSVLTAHLQAVPGDIIGPVTDTFTRPGVFVVGIDTPAKLDDLVATLRSRIIFDID